RQRSVMDPERPDFSASAPVFKAVANALDKNPNLKLEIVGYSDSVGDEGKTRGRPRCLSDAIRRGSRPPHRQRFPSRETHSLQRHPRRSSPKPPGRIPPQIAGHASVWSVHTNQLVLHITRCINGGVNAMCQAPEVRIDRANDDARVAFGT